MAQRREFLHPGDARIPILRRELEWGRGVDEVVAMLASAQHGRVARRQLVALGVGRTAIENRQRRGILRPVHRGVFAVGHEAPDAKASWSAALLAVGAGAALSHASAAALWELLPKRSAPVAVSVDAKRRPIPGIRIRRARLPASEVTVIDGITVTTPARTVVDLSSGSSVAELRRAVRECGFRRLASPLEIQRLLDAYRRRRGTARLRDVLQEVIDAPGYTRSRLEDEFLALVRELGLPVPELNARLTVDGKHIEVDCIWRSEGLVVELDGAQAHRTAAAFEEDRRRDRALIASGLTPMRATWQAVQADRATLKRDLLAAFAAKNGKSRLDGARDRPP